MIAVLADGNGSTLGGLVVVGLLVVVGIVIPAISGVVRATRGWWALRRHAIPRAVARVRNR